MEVSNVYDFQLKDFTAVTQETQESQISFRVSGPLVKLLVDEGEKVMQGQLLAEIDPRDFKINLMAKEAKYEQTKATKERFEVLYKKDAVSKNELDLRVANFFNAKSAYEDAKNALKDTKLRAQFSGFIDKKFVENFDQVGAGQPIVTMIDISVIELKFYIPENIAVQFRKFSSANAKFEVYPGVEFSTKLKEIGKKAESEGFPVTLYLDHKNLKDADYIFGPGMSAIVNLVLKEGSLEEESSVVYVPFHSIFSSGNEENPSVWVVNKNSMTVSKKSITVGQMVLQDYVQVLSGLESGEIIVTAGVSQLQESQKIKFVEDRL
ncbi:MAG: efflux RND transporter periplasmic adaptor subunit, partial [Melioribacteraceae bacterium]|nr:efflux RND transporter periplasmic adaptor subunit [Melioribacteraceae bacterium]